MVFGYSIHVPLVFKFEPRPAVKNVEYHRTSEQIKDKFSTLCIMCSDNIGTGSKLSLISRQQSTEETNSYNYKDSGLKNNEIRAADNPIKTLLEKKTPKKMTLVWRRKAESGVTQEERPEKHNQQKVLRPRKKRTKAAKQNKEDPLYVP